MGLLSKTLLICICARGAFAGTITIHPQTIPIAGTAATGPPALYTNKTNAASGSFSTLTNTMNTTGIANALVVWCFNYFPETAPSDVSANGTAATFLGRTNATAGNQNMDMWYIVGPASSATYACRVQWPSPVTECVFHCLIFTNVNQSTPFNILTNFAQSGASTISNIVQTAATGQLALGYASLANSVIAVTAGTGWTLVSHQSSGASEEESTIQIKTPIATTITNDITYTADGSGKGIMGVAIQGP